MVGMQGPNATIARHQHICAYSKSVQGRRYLQYHQTCKEHEKLTLRLQYQLPGHLWKVSICRLPDHPLEQDGTSFPAPDAESYGTQQGPTDSCQFIYIWLIQFPGMARSKVYGEHRG
jgi:hypothetical protein